MGFPSLSDGRSCSDGSHQLLVYGKLFERFDHLMFVISRVLFTNNLLIPEYGEYHDNAY